MNNRYFTCPACKTYTSAGYRWAYWTLEEKGTVTFDIAVDVEAVLAAEAYWNPVQDSMSKWLYQEVLPTVRTFLSGHKDHGIRYVDVGGDFFCQQNFDEWVEIEASDS